MGEAAAALDIGGFGIYGNHFKGGKADLNIPCICDAFVRYPVLMVKITKAVRINERHIEELEKLAKKEGETVSFLIQQAIREYLERKAAK
jgi:Ribbon-helix-helix protein, copG family